VRATWIVLAALVVLPRVAGAQETTLVVIAVDDDEALSDGLTEVAVARLADRRDRDLVAGPELRARLERIAPAGDLAACVVDPACLSRLGVFAEAVAITGRVKASGAGFSLSLALTETATRRRVAEVPETNVPDRERLVAAVQSGIDDLLRPRASVIRPTPPPVERPRAGGRPAAASLLAGPPADDVSSPGGGRRAAPSLAYGAGGLALVSIGAALVTGAIAVGVPEGDTRGERQADLDRRADYATAANALWISSAVFAAIAAGALAWHWRAR
jgi:hypothetical protein